MIYSTYGVSLWLVAIIIGQLGIYMYHTKNRVLHKYVILKSKSVWDVFVGRDKGLCGRLDKTHPPTYSLCVQMHKCKHTVIHTPRKGTNVEILDVPSFQESFLLRVLDYALTVS